MSPGSGYLADDVLQRSCADYRADLHALCNITRVINLVYEAGRKANLVAIGGVARSSGLAQLALRQLVFEGLRQRYGRVTAHRSRASPDKRRSDRRAGRGSHRRGR